MQSIYVLLLTAGYLETAGRSASYPEKVLSHPPTYNPIASGQKRKQVNQEKAHSLSLSPTSRAL